MKSIGTQILQTDRLILRRFLESDAAVSYTHLTLPTTPYV